MKAADLPLTYNAVDIVERNLPDRADKVALYSHLGELTFGQVSARVNQVGHGLLSLDVHDGDTVALLAPDVPAEANWCPPPRSAVGYSVPGATISVSGAKVEPQFISPSHEVTLARSSQLLVAPTAMTVSYLAG